MESSWTYYSITVKYGKKPESEIVKVYISDPAGRPSGEEGLWVVKAAAAFTIGVKDKTGAVGDLTCVMMGAGNHVSSHSDKEASHITIKPIPEVNETDYRSSFCAHFYADPVNFYQGDWFRKSRATTNKSWKDKAEAAKKEDDLEVDFSGKDLTYTELSTAKNKI
ncbi:hypothetical protein BX600DRAFT_431609 [Xylariales sp. PMI_506]|nr:hypothetical protein BX600DRAFT_431609 [Xylariales sp. PMI_506]